MMKLTLLFVALCASVAFANVIVGTVDNFEDLIEENEHVLVEFYAPWCGHCKKLAPEYDAAAATLAEEGSAIKLVKVDATVEGDLAQEYEVRGYPTLIFFSGGEQITYDGDRSAEGLVRWVKKKSGPPSVELADDALEAFTAEEPAVVGTFADAESKAFKAFTRVAKVESDFNFGHIFAEGEEGVKVHVDGKVLEFEGKITKTGLKSWLHAEGFPSLVELNQQSWTRSSSNKINLFTAFFPADDEATKELILSVAQKTKGKVMATFIDSAANKQLAERWGASGKVFPTATALIYGEGSEPAMNVWDENGVEFNEENLIAFIDACIEGTYTSYLKSEPEPEDNDGPVKVIVGTTFEDIVFDAEKDVLVEFYAPWCGHCKKLAPIYDQLGELFAEHENVVIAKIDATANAFPKNIPVQGYPTLLFFPAGSETPIPFSGDRNLEELVSFVTEKSSTPVKVDL